MPEDTHLGLNLDAEARARYEALRKLRTDKNGVLRVTPNCDNPANNAPGIREVGPRNIRGRRLPGKI